MAFQNDEMNGGGQLAPHLPPGPLPLPREKRRGKIGSPSPSPWSPSSPTREEEEGT